MNHRIKIIIAVVSAAAISIGVKETVAQSPQQRVEKAQEAVEKATKQAADADEAAQKADADAKDPEKGSPNSPDDNVADDAESTAAKAEQDARDAQDKADESQAAKDRNEAGSADKAKTDQDAAQKAAEKAQKAEKEADAADARADKGRSKDHPLRKKHEAQKKKRAAAQKLWEAKRKLKQLQRAVGLIALGAIPRGEVLASLIGEGKIAATVTSTGKTIGDVATLSLRNLTSSSIDSRIPPVALISASGAYQTYAVPFGQTVSVPAHALVNTPLDGICLNARKPPVGAGVAGELAVVDGGGNQLIAPAAGALMTSYPAVLASTMISATRVESAVAKLNTMVGPTTSPQKLEGGGPISGLTQEMVSSAILHNTPQTIATAEKLNAAVNQLFQTALATATTPIGTNALSQAAQNAIAGSDQIVASASGPKFPISPQPAPPPQEDSAEVKAAKKKLGQAQEDLHNANEAAIDAYNGGNNVGGPSDGSHPDKGPDSDAYKRALEDVHAAEDKAREAQGAVLLASDPNNPNAQAVRDAQEAVKAAERDRAYAGGNAVVARHQGGNYPSKDAKAHIAEMDAAFEKAKAAVNEARAKLRAALRKFGEKATTSTPTPTPSTEAPPIIPSLIPTSVDDSLNATAQIFQVSQQLQSTHKYTTPFSGEPKKELETIRQWTVWRWQSIEEGQPITKTDMAKKVYEQVGGTRKLTDSQKADLKKGVDNIWSAVELTGEQAKLTSSSTKES